MTQLQGIIKGDAFHKIGGAGFIIGAILLAISGLIMPHAANPTSDLKEMLTPLGEHQFLTKVSSLLLILGFWAVLFGVTGVYPSITSSGVTWARFAFSFTLLGTALWTISLFLDVATASAVANWLSAPLEGKDVAWSGVAALSAVGRWTVPITWTVYWLALALLSVSMIQSISYPHWLGWIGLAVSIPTVALGVFQTFNARSITLTLIFSVLMLLTILWDLALGIWIARKA
jgi:hypothetical protein